MSLDAEVRLYIVQATEQAADKAVARMLVALGIDASNPLEMQKDLASLRELRRVMDGDEYIKDQLHLREWRLTMERVQGKGFMAAIGLTVVGAAVLIFTALKFKVFGHA